MQLNDTDVICWGLSSLLSLSSLPSSFGTCKCAYLSPCLHGCSSIKVRALRVCAAHPVNIAVRLSSEIPVPALVFHFMIFFFFLLYATSARVMRIGTDTVPVPTIVSGIRTDFNGTVKKIAIGDAHMCTFHALSSCLIMIHLWQVQLSPTTVSNATLFECAFFPLI